MESTARLNMDQTIHHLFPYEKKVIVLITKVRKL